MAACKGSLKERLSRYRQIKYVNARVAQLTFTELSCAMFAYPRLRDIKSISQFPFHHVATCLKSCEVPVRVVSILGSLAAQGRVY
jgi:hypothetical protein